MPAELYKFELSFDGNLVENSVDAFDLANTILALSQALDQISSIKFEGLHDHIKINVNAFRRGSFSSEFLVFIDQAKDTALALSPLFPGAVTTGYTIGKELLSSLKLYIDVRQLLKGKPPQKVEYKNTGEVIIHAGNNNQITVNNYDFRVLQDSRVSKNVDRVVQPLIKPDSQITHISINQEGKSLADINKENALYLLDEQGFQIIDNFKLKGFVTKIDTKTCAGYLNLGDTSTGKRVSFNFPINLPQNKLHILIDSLESKIKVYLIGKAQMDYEGNPRTMSVIDVHQDEDLFS